jgi:hypothetical protein
MLSLTNPVQSSTHCSNDTVPKVVDISRTIVYFVSVAGLISSEAGQRSPMDIQHCGPHSARDIITVCRNTIQVKTVEEYPAVHKAHQV